jgi:hypothetical protein
LLSLCELSGQVFMLVEIDTERRPQSLPPTMSRRGFVVGRWCSTDTFGDLSGRSESETLLELGASRLPVVVVDVDV